MLDVNVLLALAWGNHEFHRKAVTYMEQHDGPWLTCAITQLGFIRLSLHPHVARPVVGASDVLELLAQMTSDSLHQYIDTAPPLNPKMSAGIKTIFGYKQVTDAYLIALAQSNGATFVTFDRRLAVLANPSNRIEILSN